MKRYIPLVLATSILLGCQAAPKTNSTTINGLTPEEALLKIDGGGNTKPYAQNLDKLQKRCRETREDIAVMAYDVATQYKTEDPTFSTLDALENFVEILPGFESPRISCMDVRKVMLHYLDD